MGHRNVECPYRLGNHCEPACMARPITALKKLAKGALEMTRYAAGKTMRGMKITERSIPTVRNFRKAAQIFESNLVH